MGTWEDALQSAGVTPRQPAWAYPDAVAHVENTVGEVMPLAAAAHAALELH